MQPVSFGHRPYPVHFGARRPSEEPSSSPFTPRSIVNDPTGAVFAATLWGLGKVVGAVFAVADLGQDLRKGRRPYIQPGAVGERSSPAGNTPTNTVLRVDDSKKNEWFWTLSDYCAEQGRTMLTTAEVEALARDSKIPANQLVSVANEMGFIDDSPVEATRARAAAEDEELEAEEAAAPADVDDFLARSQALLDETEALADTAHADEQTGDE